MCVLMVPLWSPIFKRVVHGPPGDHTLKNGWPQGDHQNTHFHEPFMKLVFRLGPLPWTGDEPKSVVHANQMTFSVTKLRFLVHLVHKSNATIYEYLPKNTFATTAPHRKFGSAPCSSKRDRISSSWPAARWIGAAPSSRQLTEPDQVCSSCLHILQKFSEHLEI